MPRQLQLDPDYYLRHFQEFTQFISELYQPVLLAEHRAFLNSYQQLPLDAKRLWLRMLNRKGDVFALADLGYAEITDGAAAQAALIAENFATALQHSTDVANWLHRASKPQLWALLLDVPLQQQLNQALVEPIEVANLPKKSADRAQLRFAAEQRLSALALPTQCAVLQRLLPCLVLRRRAEVEYLLFLYFGRMEQNLQAFTLRDLGVLPQPGVKTVFQARYLDVETARSAFYYARLSQQLAQQLPARSSKLSLAELAYWQQQLPDWPEPLDDASQLQREKICYQLGKQAEKWQLLPAAIVWYQQSNAYPATERLLRLYRQQGVQASWQQLLTQMLSDPGCDEELSCARDLAARHAGNRQLSDLTVLLQQADQLVLDELYLNCAEQGVVAYYQRQGGKAFYTENNLWLALFGLLFWHELFEAADSAIFNAFERRPRHLSSGGFYRSQTVAIEQKLTLLHQPIAALRRVLQTLTDHWQRPNAIFRWQADLAEQLSLLLRHAPATALAPLLRQMAQDFRHHSSGFPDLMLWQQQQQQLSFIEVKAPGDSIRRNQLSRIHQLQQLGFNVRLERVSWGLDPAQCYAVVDVETTGGRADSDRITEIALVKVQHGQVIARFSSLVNPQRRVPSFISRLTGITDQMVATAPLFGELAEQLRIMLADCIFVAHNVKFDAGFVRAEFQRAGIDWQAPQLCTVVQSRRYFKGLASYGLAALASHFQLPLTQHHRALADAEATAALLLLIQQQRQAPLLVNTDELT